ncbi:MAG: phospho-N-acetylmuramoyl-pentapeptide-transferase [Burkholderiales bacterium]|jgi:phospho-N-acetylmuramoyl-pentapeptide-transferase|nr:phospho-N-acetylmuramoyl-pentapeptide-transferase [Burkholderiales bacterium]
MLYLVAQYLEQVIGAFRVFEYVTFRALLAGIFSLAISIGFGQRVINWLTQLKVGQTVRSDGPQTHLVKSGTPTMGGVLIILSITITILLVADLTNLYIWVLLFVLISTGALGFIDDYRKVVYKDPKGLPPRAKMLAQSAIAIGTGLFLIYVVKMPNATEVVVPFFKLVQHPFGVIGFLVLTYFVIVGSSNAVNLTDGLDGLVSVPVVIVALGLAIFAYIAGHKIFAGYLYLPHVPGAHEVVVFCAAIVGATLGFLWFNAYPAQVFMGDVGALSLGAVLGTIAIIVRQEIVFGIMAGLFVIEAISVMLQVGSYKLRKKRIFLMAPIHHHFELKGWKETQVVVRFWIISIIFLLISLSTIKLR